MLLTTVVSGALGRNCAELEVDLLIRVHDLTGRLLYCFVIIRS